MTIDQKAWALATISFGSGWAARMAVLYTREAEPRYLAAGIAFSLALFLLTSAIIQGRKWLR